MIERRPETHRGFFEIPADTRRRFLAALEVIPNGARVTLEGPPIYLNRPWDDGHEFGYNRMLCLAAEVFQARGQRIEHRVLIDDYSGSSGLRDYVHQRQITLPIDEVVYESALVEEAEAELQRLIGERKTLRVGQDIRLAHGRMPVLRTRDGRLGCALLDAVFQRSKGEGWHVIVHPRSFRRQQAEMRQVLEVVGRTPEEFCLLNVFTRGDRLSQVLATDTDWDTRNLGV